MHGYIHLSLKITQILLMYSTYYSYYFIRDCHTSWVAASSVFLDCGMPDEQAVSLWLAVGSDGIQVINRTMHDLNWLTFKPAP